jgi:membrane fusion protein
MASKLFREEALVAKGSGWIGNIVLIQPVPIKIASFVSLVIFIALILFIFLGGYTRKVRVSGQLIPENGSLHIHAPQYGTIVNKKVNEGDIVEAGSVLFEINSARTGADGGIEERIHKSISTRLKLLDEEKHVQTRVLKERQNYLHSSMENINFNISRLIHETDIQKRRIKNSIDNLSRIQSLDSSGFATSTQIQQADNDLIEQQARLVMLERTLISARRDLLQTTEEFRQIDNQLRLQNKQSERAAALLEQEEAELQVKKIVQVLSPVAGMVSAITLEKGATTQAGQTLATIIPENSPLEAHLWAPSSSIGFAENDQKVRLRLAAFPYQKFGQIKGKVKRVDKSPIVNNSASFTQAAVSGAVDSRFRIVVSLEEQHITAYEKKYPFKPGLLVEADIMQDHRKLIEWVFDPILSFAQVK